MQPPNGEAEDAAAIDPKKMQKQQTKTMNAKMKGKEAVNREIEAIKKQRLA